MKAITTKYHGPTNTRGSRISASDSDGNRASIPYPRELSGDDCHALAAAALCKKMGWTGKLISGGTSRGVVFVFADSFAYDATTGGGAPNPPPPYCPRALRALGAILKGLKL